MREILAEGTWCTNCEVFEEPDVDGNRCMACGCSVDLHRDVQVVTLP